MKALDQWRQLERQLDPDWDVVSLSFVPDDVSRAAAVLAPLGPGRYGRELRFQVSRRGGGLDGLVNILRRLDGNRVWGELTLVDARVERHEEPADTQAEEGGRPSLAAQWDEEVGKLAPGWRDLLVELDLGSTDFLAQAALLGAALNLSRVPGRIALHFRVAEHGGGGYGASAGMARQCLERMDAAGITGELRILHALADVDYVATQGPVWRVAGRSV
jgi:hypothetical protein